MKPKVGCFFIYSIFLILIGMGSYKYRAELLDYLSQKYSELISKASVKIEEAKDDAKINSLQ